MVEKRLETAGEDLVDVGLMAYVEEDLVFRCGEDGVQSKRELDDAEVGTEMAAGFGECLDEEAADFVRERDHLVVIQPLEVSGRMNGLQKALPFHSFPRGIGV